MQRRERSGGGLAAALPSSWSLYMNVLASVLQLPVVRDEGKRQMESQIFQRLEMFRFWNTINVVFEVQSNPSTFNRWLDRVPRWCKMFFLFTSFGIWRSSLLSSFNWGSFSLIQVLTLVRQLVRYFRHWETSGSKETTGCHLHNGGRRFNVLWLFQVAAGIEERIAKGVRALSYTDTNVYLLNMT